MKKTDLMSLIFIAAAFYALVVFNIFQPQRETISESENRTLASAPDFSVAAFFDGSFAKDAGSFFSDTFVLRENMLFLSKKITALYGSALNIQDEDGVHYIAVMNETEYEAETVKIPETSSFTQTSEPETEVTSETEAETEITVTEPPESSAVEIPDLIDEIILSSKTLYIAEGSSQTLSASIIPEDAEGVLISWTSDNSGIVSLKALTDRIQINGLKKGTATVTASNGKIKASCEIIVSHSIEPTGEGNSVGIVTNEPEFLTNGMFIYRGAVYSIPYLVEKSARYYAQTVGYYASLFSSAKISVLIPPLASGMLDRDITGQRLTDQKDIIHTISGYMDGAVNNVEIFDNLWLHRDEYLYYKSDHHWSARGAYYAYEEFARSVGFDPVPISDMTEVVLNDKFQGTMYSFTGDERVKSIYDTLYAYIPTKKHTMTIYHGASGTTYDSSVIQSAKNYGAFIGGDYAYMIINTPENPQDVNILVLKDSYGNAMIPYLTEHYGNIVVVDPRHVTFNIYDLLSDYPLRDVLFLNNIYNPNVSSWSTNLLRSVGVN